MQHDFILPFLRASLTEDQLCRVEASTQPQNVRSGIQRKGGFCPVPFLFPFPKIAPSCQPPPHPLYPGKCRNEIPGVPLSLQAYHPRCLHAEFAVWSLANFWGYQKVLAPQKKKKRGNPFLLQKNRLHLSESTKPTMGKTMPTVL